MNTRTQNTSELTKELNFNFWLDTSCEKELVTLFHDAIHNNTKNAPLNEWIQKAEQQVNHLEQLLYNSYHLCPTLYHSVFTKISKYNTAILEFNKSMETNRIDLPQAGKNYHKQLLAVQLRIQIVLMYLHV